MEVLSDTDAPTAGEAHIATTPAFDVRSPSPFIGGPEDVTLKIYWKPHPLNTAAEPQTWGFKMGRVCSASLLEIDVLNTSDAFSRLFDECADSASVRVETVIVSFDEKRIYLSASLHGIGVFAEAELGKF